MSGVTGDRARGWSVGEACVRLLQLLPCPKQEVVNTLPQRGERDGLPWAFCFENVQGSFKISQNILIWRVIVVPFHLSLPGTSQQPDGSWCGVCMVPHGGGIGGVVPCSMMVACGGGIGGVLPCSMTVACGRGIGGVVPYSMVPHGGVCGVWCPAPGRLMVEGRLEWCPALWWWHKGGVAMKVRFTNMCWCNILCFMIL